MTSSVVAIATVDARPDGTILAAAAGLAMTVIAAIQGYTHWYLPVATLLVVAVAVRAWAADWRARQVETDQRFDDLIDSANMFFWEVDPSTATVLSVTGNIGLVGFYTQLEHPGEQPAPPGGPGGAATGQMIDDDGDAAEAGANGAPAADVADFTEISN